MGFTITSRSSIVLDVLLLLTLILNCVYVGLFRAIDTKAVLEATGHDFYIFAWMTSGGFLSILILLFVTSFIDGDSLRRSWMAILFMIFGGTCYFAMAVTASVHVYDIDWFKYNLTVHEVNCYKFLLAADYIMAILMWLSGALRIMFRLRSGDGKS